MESFNPREKKYEEIVKIRNYEKLECPWFSPQGSPGPRCGTFPPALSAAAPKVRDLLRDLGALLGR